jgi:glycosyltransferase involved in cell wall biosynthesis
MSESGDQHAPVSQAPVSKTAVSVVIPAYNAENYLAEAIASVLAQTAAVHEIIVVNDGSTDRTAEIATGFGARVRLVKQANSGAAAARNHGVRQSTGEYLAFLDADDLWVPPKLAVQLAALSSVPAPEIVFGLITQFRSSELPVDAVHLPEGAEEPQIGHLAGTMLLRRDTFDAIGWFTEDQERGDFIDWFARALEQQRRILVVDEVTMLRRLHLSNMGRTARLGPEEYARVLRRVIERRRNARYSKFSTG